MSLEQLKKQYKTLKAYNAANNTTYTRWNQVVDAAPQPETETKENTAKKAPKSAKTEKVVSIPEIKRRAEEKGIKIYKAPRGKKTCVEFLGNPQTYQYNLTIVDVAQKIGLISEDERVALRKRDQRHLKEWFAWIIEEKENGAQTFYYLADDPQRHVHFLSTHNGTGFDSEKHTLKKAYRIGEDIEIEIA